MLLLVVQNEIHEKENLKNRLTIIIFSIIIALAVLSLFISIIPGWKIRDLTTAEALALEFLDREMTNEQGGIFYRLPGSYQILSESTALLMWYAALKGDRDLFESQFRVTQNYLLDEDMGLLYWKLRASMDPWSEGLPEYSNASIDDLTTVKALLLGYERWEDESYLSLAEVIASGILHWNITDGTLRSSTSWASDYQSFNISDTIILSYVDLLTVKQTGGNNTKWLEAIDSTMYFLFEGQLENGLFWYAYDVNQKRYLAEDEDNGVNSVIQMALTANHLAEAGFREQATEFLNFFKREYASGAIYGNYSLHTGKAVEDVENIAGYAWMAILAENFDDEHFAQKLVREKLIPSQCLDKSSSLFGAFTLSQDEVYAYDQLVTLILMRTLINKHSGIPINTSWIALYFLVFAASYVVVASVMSRFPNKRIRSGEATEHYFTILIPAKNEECVIKHTLDSIFYLDYPSDKLDVLVINDGSTDNTGAIVEAYVAREHRLRVLNIPQNEGGKGKGAALNRGLQYLFETGIQKPADSWIIGVFDADSRIENQMLKKVSFQFLDQRIGGVQTLVRITNADRNLLAKMQDVEFLVFGDVIERSRSNYGGAVFLGGNGQFIRMSALESARICSRDPEFWKPNALTEDAELGLRIMMEGYKNVFINKTSVYQEGIEKLDDFLRQRVRWARGTLDVLLDVLGPSLWRSRLSWPAKIDLVYTFIVSLTMPLVIPIIWVLNIIAAIGIISLQNMFPNPVLWANVLILVPLIFIGIYSKSGYHLLKVPLYCFIAIIYVLHWVFCMWIVFGLMALRRQRTWEKTRRVGAQ